MSCEFIHVSDGVCGNLVHLFRGGDVKCCLFSCRLCWMLVLGVVS